MTSNMFIVLLILYVLVDMGWAQADVSSKRPTCDQLPKVPFPSNEKWSANGPLQFLFSISPQFECSTVTFTPPERGSKDYHGFAIHIKGNKATAFHYTLGSDLKSAHSFDSEGYNLTWLAIDSDPEGGFHCSYICDGPALLEFTCDTNNDDKFRERIANAVALARQVPNGEKIHEAQKDCTKRKHIVF